MSDSNQQSNKEKLNSMFPSTESVVDVKFFINPNASDGAEALCGEAIEWFEAERKGELIESTLLEKRDNQEK